MTLDEFWSLIERSRRGAESCDEQVERLAYRLAELPPEEIEAFDRHLTERRIEAYRWDLWGAAYIINGGCSDDGFEYFRCWLISKGRKFFEATLADPEYAGRGVSDDDVQECEPLLGVAGEAYERTTGRDLPPASIDYPAEPTGRRWDEAELPGLFPKLWKRFG